MHLLPYNDILWGKLEVKLLDGKLGFIFCKEMEKWESTTVLKEIIDCNA